MSCSQPSSTIIGISLRCPSTGSNGWFSPDRGRLGDARALTRRALDGFLALGMRPMAAGCGQALAQIELSDGDALAARASLQRCDDLLAELSERPQRSTTQAMLARVHARLGAT